MDAFTILKSAIYGAIAADAYARTSYSSIILEVNESIRLAKRGGNIDKEDIKKRLSEYKSSFRNEKNGNTGGIAFASSIPLAFAETSDEDIEAIAYFVSHDPTLRPSCVVLMHTIIDIIGGLSLQDSLNCLSRSTYYSESFSHLANIKNLSLEEILTAKDEVGLLGIAMWCVLNTSCFEKCVTQAATLKEECGDVIPCISGALAGMVYGYECIPLEWLNCEIDTAVIDSSLFNANEFSRMQFILEKRAEKENARSEIYLRFHNVKHSAELVISRLAETEQSCADGGAKESEGMSCLLLNSLDSLEQALHKVSIRPK